MFQHKKVINSFVKEVITKNKSFTLENIFTTIVLHLTFNN